MNVTINESNRILDSAITGYGKIARDNLLILYIYIARTHKNYTITHCSLLGQNRCLTLLYVKVESKFTY